MKNAKTVLVSVLVAVLGNLCAACETETGELETSKDVTALKQDLEKVIAYVDSDAYRESLSFEEHVVATYHAVKNREPTAFELYILSALKADLDLPRSAVLAIAMRGEDGQLNEAAYRHFVEQRGVTALKKTHSISKKAARLAPAAQKLSLTHLPAVEPPAAPRAAVDTLPLAAAAPGETYNTYFGFLHAHTEYSDGSGTPEEAYAYARDTAGLDFFAITDHGEMLDLWPWETEWRNIRNAAASANRPGSFVALTGFEWSNPLLGHVNVINTSDFTDTLSDFWLGSLYDWIAARPEAFARFNHPGEYDSLGAEFYHMDLYPHVIDQMVGMETWNGGNSFDHYFYDGGWESDNAYIDEGNLNGWRLGALGAEDNHDKNWGTATTYATAVLATELSQQAIVAAYRARRFYATEDRDLYLDVRCQGYPMGAEIAASNPTFTVSGRDAGGDTFSEVRLYRNGAHIRTTPVSGSAFSTTVSDSFTGAAYYYVVVKQTDDSDGNGRDDEAISSPIWIE